LFDFELLTNNIKVRRISDPMCPFSHCVPRPFARVYKQRHRCMTFDVADATRT
jgi:hypothetical protein